MDQHEPSQVGPAHCRAVTRVPARPSSVCLWLPAHQSWRSRSCLAQSSYLVIFEPPKERDITVHVDISLHFTFGVILCLSGWMIFKSISNSPRTSKASRITKQTTRICWRRRTDMSPLPARTDRQEEPMRPSAKRAPTPHVPDLAGCVSWSFLLLPPRTPTPAAPGQWVISTKSRAHETTWLPTKHSHFPLLGGWGWGGGWVRGAWARGEHVPLPAPWRACTEACRRSGNTCTCCRAAHFWQDKPSSEAAATLAGAASSHELCPTSALLSQMALAKFRPHFPSAWVYSASPETCGSWRAFSSCPGMRHGSWWAPPWSLNPAASPHSPPPPPPISGSRCSTAQGHPPPRWSASGTWTWLCIKLASPCQCLRDKSRASPPRSGLTKDAKSPLFHHSEHEKSVTLRSDVAGQAAWMGPADGKLLNGGAACFASPPTARRRAPAALPDAVCTLLCCSTTRNFLVRLFPSISKQSIDYRRKKCQPLSRISWCERRQLPTSHWKEPLCFY